MQASKLKQHVVLWKMLQPSRPVKVSRVFVYILKLRFRKGMERIFIDLRTKLCILDLLH